MLRTVIIDDEPSAVNVLATLLRNKCRNDVEVVATTTSAEEGKHLIEQHHPDLVFLDIEMPVMTGLEIVRSFEHPAFRTVFVTAHDDYAIQAFELSAVNYLLKPIGPESVVKTVEKIKDAVQRNQNNIAEPIQKLERLLNKHANSNDTKIGIAMAEKIVFVYIKDILYCEANGAYTNLYLTEMRKMVASKPLGYFEILLVNHRFFRIHHSFVINLNRIKEFQRHDGGYVVMENNKQLEVSRRKKAEFLQTIDDFVV
jgi:two-component system, LytTR family, response regulator